MANLTAVFELVDKISDKLDVIASKGSSAVDSFEMMGDVADRSFGGVSSATDTVVSAVSGYSNAIEGAAGTTDFWTDAVGNFDKSALEAVYTTEELVEMGMKSAKALEEEQSVMELAQMATEDLNTALENSVNIHDNCAEAMEKASQMAEHLAENDKVSEQAKVALQEATEQAASAFEELEAAQNEAQSAMDNYNAVAESGTATITELEAAALNAATAADRLVEANEKATSTTEDLSKATDEACEEAEKANEKGVNAIEGIASALAGAGITATVKEIAETVYDLTDAFSEAESTVVLATGATGDTLDGLTDSMMNAYAVSKTGSLDETAAAVGEINTRLGYTDEQLTETTGLFLDFAAVTGGNAASSVRSVTQLMNQWHVPATEMESILSRLTYAGQASGISVDTLSGYLTNNKAVLDQLGFSLDEATAMFMKFELAGTNTAAVMTGFRKALSSGAITSLEELYDVFDQISSGAMSAADASELFGTKAGPAIVNAVKDGTLSLDSMVAALENADGTLKTTAEAAQTFDQKWEQATDNVGAAFSNALSPAINDVSSSLAGLLNGVGDFLNKHPAVVKGISATAAVIGTVVAAFGVYTAAQGIATAATALFGATLSAAIWPATLVVGAIAAVVGVVVGLTSALTDEIDVTENMTMTARKQQEELENLNAEYDMACDKYGENSRQAEELALQISKLEKEYADGSETIGEFSAKIDESGEIIDNRIQSYQDAVEQIGDLKDNSLTLASELMVLSEKGNLTSSDLDMMSGIVGKLNSNYEDLGLTIDKTSGKLNFSVSDLYDVITEKADEQKRQATMDSLTEAIAQFGDVKAQSAQASQEVAAAWDNLEEVEENWKKEHPIKAKIAGDAAVNWSSDIGNAFKEWEALNSAASNAHDNYDSLVEEITLYCQQLGYSDEETEEFISKLEDAADASNNLAEAEQTATEAGAEYEEACSTALEEVKDRVDELCVAYDEAYQSALESFSGQFGLFDEASTKSEEYLNSSVDNAQKALDSQLSYWETYNADLDTLVSYGEGLTGKARENYELLLSYAQDGSEEAAGLAASMADAIEQGDTEAINKLSETVGAVREKQEEATAATAEWQTNFNATMDGIVSDMSTRISEMGFVEEANQAALDTMQGYASGIKTGSNDAITQIGAVATAISTALENSEVKAKIDIEPNTEAVDGYKMPEKTATAKYELDSDIVDKYQPEDKSAITVYEVDDTAVDRYKPPDKTATVTYNVQTNGTVPGHAQGTTYAEDMFIAGEDGPELIVGQQGSTVFPHSETERIIGALSKQNDAINIVNEYEPTGFMSKLESAFSKLTDKMSAIFEKLGNVAPTVELEGYATGTTSSDDSFIAGEDGPELIVNKPDSVIFPTGETEKIVDAVSALNNEPITNNYETDYEYSNNYKTDYDYSKNYKTDYDYSKTVDQSVGDSIDKRTYNSVGDSIDKRVYSYDYSTNIDQSTGDTYEQKDVDVVERPDNIFVPPENSNIFMEDTNLNGDASTKKILLEIAGKGNIELTGGKVNKEALLSFLYEYLKPVLSEIITQEVYEEGDMSYEY